MTYVPYPRPTTRAEARANAIELSNLAMEKMTPGMPLSEIQAAATTSAVWAAIAQTFPESQVTDQIFGDDQPIEEDYRPDVTSRPDETMVLSTVPRPRIGHVMTSGTTGTITVEATAWDVLRALAVRYVMSSLEGRVTLRIEEAQSPDNPLELMFMPDEPIVHVTVAQS